jgi:multidrug efflux system membrane fusion protein
VIKLILRIILPILVLAGAGYGTVTIIRNRPVPETRAAAITLPLVETIEAGYSNVTLSVFAEGTVAPRTVSELTPEVAGRVIDVADSLVVGGFFEEGDVLLRLDARDYELAVTRGQSAIAQAKLRLETERQEAAVAMVEWELLGSGRPTPLAMREPHIAEALAALASAEAALQQSEYDLERTIVVAPFAGRVRQEHIDIGQFVARGNSVATLYSVDSAEVRLPIPDSELAFLSLNLAYREESSTAEAIPDPRVIIRSQFAGREHEWSGRVVRTEGEIDPRTRMVHAIARVEDPYARGNDPNRPPLAVGMFVEAEIIGRSSGSVVVLPRTVLRGADRVLIVDSADQVRFRQVELFRLERDRILVSSGIEEGDRIIVSPLENAVDGMEVQVQEASVEPDVRARSNR